MTTLTKKLGVMAVAALAVTACRGRDDAEPGWSEQPRETASAPVTGKKIGPSNCEPGESASENCPAE